MTSAARERDGRPGVGARGGEKSTPLVLAAGGCHNAWCWLRLVPELERRGVHGLPAELPTDRDDAGLDAYAEATAAPLKGRTVEGTAMLGHSLAGRYLPLAAARAGVERVIFLCAMIPEEGRPGPPLEEPTDASHRLTLSREHAMDLFYHDCDPELAHWAAARLVPQSLTTREEVFPEGGWPSGLRCAVVAGTDDRVFPLEEVRRAAASRLGVAPVEIPGGHSPFLARPAALAEAVSELLGGGLPEHWGSYGRPDRGGP